MLRLIISDHDIAREGESSGPRVDKILLMQGREWSFLESVVACPICVYFDHQHD